MDVFELCIVCLDHLVERPITEGSAVKSASVQAHYFGIGKPGLAVTCTNWQLTFHVDIEVRIQEISVLVRDCFYKLKELRTFEQEVLILIKQVI